MQTKELKEKIQTYLTNADDRILRIVNSVFENYYNDGNEIVAFHPDGTPMTKKEYKNALDKAEKQIQNGNFISAEEFEHEE